ncbi:hypothetical protein [Paractinoplanes maris]|uniref:hypothetical protein n=1 Tax=Paractinoplanes maris TaxID=1734446 RepID=UPI00201FB6FB|nr:hypothetical protein [Actinoplanes maris]
MDIDEASNALAEIEKRRQETLDRGGPLHIPAWFTYGGAAALALAWAGSDVTRPASTVMTAAGFVAVLSLAWALERSTGIRLRMSSLRLAPILLFGVAVVGTGIVIGTILRLLDVPVAGTISGLAAGAVWVAAMGRTQAAATRRRPA